MASRSGHRPVEYEFAPLDEKDAASVASWNASAVLDKDTVVVSFANSYCPVCGDDAHPPNWSAPRIGGIALTEIEASGSERIVVRCSCSEVHSGRPLTEPFGCGRVWTVHFEWDATPSVGPVTPGPTPSNADLKFPALLADLNASELTRVRAQAEGWSRVMAALTGLIGVGQVIAAQSVANVLEPPWRNAVGAALLVALVAAAAATVASGLAAYGRLGTIQLSDTAPTGGEAGRFQAEVDRLVGTTKKRLVVAAVSAGLAFALVLSSGAVMWWGPRDSSTTSTAVCVASPDGMVTKLASLPKVSSGSLVVVACGP